MPVPLRRTYASLSLELNCPTNSFSCSSSTASTASPSSPVTTGLITELVPQFCTVHSMPAQSSKPQTVFPIIKLPTVSSHCRHASLGSRRCSLHGCPNSKSKPGLYHKVLTSYLKKTAEGRRFLRKAKNKIPTAPAAKVTTDDKWTVPAIDAGVPLAG
jgi:hypothetical protein